MRKLRLHQGWVLPPISLRDPDHWVTLQKPGGSFSEFGSVYPQYAASEANVRPPDVAPTIDSFSAQPNPVAEGATATLAWSLSGQVTSLSIDGDVGDVTGLSSVQVTPGATTSYKLTATNGTAVSTSVVTLNVTPEFVAPTINSFTATPGSVVQGNSATLSWSLSGQVTRLEIDGGIGVVSGNSLVVSPSVTRTYRLTAWNETASSTAVVTVTVTAAQVTLSRNVTRDARANANGGFGSGVNVIDVGSTSALPDTWSVMELTNVQVDRFSRIDQATIPLVLSAGDVNPSSAGRYYSYLVATINPTFPVDATTLRALPVTAASTLREIPAAPGIDAVFVWDFAAALKEQVDKASWVKGGSVLLMLRPEDASTRRLRIQGCVMRVNTATIRFTPPDPS